ncbi:conserved hypothetical protein [Pantoea brenneri]|uniref:Uncharacterized protein n=1 Tax=Pantoea brenneri TaxID=472694 RepID=A0AAX3J3I1_9GAMM|nr:hypothetical protein [Pantoea brenneri]VXB50947.1 conserved hypothetical protein [Pantoea brenneri]
MTAKELIITYLQQHKGGSRSVDIHAHLVEHGLKRESSMSALSKLVHSGEVLRARFRQDYICWLKNTSVVISPSELRNRLSNANRRLNAMNSINVVFDECRTNSQVYRMDQLLRSAREVRA